MPADPGLRELRGMLASSLGDQIAFDDGARALYATDASNYRRSAGAVVLPRTDRRRSPRPCGSCRELGVPVLGARRRAPAWRAARSAAVWSSTSRGTSTASWRSTRSARTARVEPGVVLDDLRARPRAARAGLRPRPLHAQPLHDRRHDRQQRLRLALGALGQDRRQRRGAARRLLTDGSRLRLGATPTRRTRRGSRGGRAGAGSRRPCGTRRAGTRRSSARRFAGVPAPGLGLRRWTTSCPRTASAPRPGAGRQRGHLRDRPGGDRRPAPARRIARPAGPRLPRRLRRRRRRPRACCRIARSRLEGIDDALVEALRGRSAARLPVGCPAGRRGCWSRPAATRAEEAAGPRRRRTAAAPCGRARRAPAARAWSTTRSGSARLARSARRAPGHRDAARGRRRGVARLGGRRRPAGTARRVPARTSDALLGRARPAGAWSTATSARAACTCASTSTC